MSSSRDRVLELPAVLDFIWMQIRAFSRTRPRFIARFVYPNFHPVSLSSALSVLHASVRVRMARSTTLGA
jgi:hypothetical protein